MLNLIIGQKGSGKTKEITKRVNEAAEKSNGSVILIEKGSVSKFTVTHKARLIDIDETSISNYSELYGFIEGVLLSNYDITHIFVDATLRIGGRNMKDVNNFLKQINNHMAKNVIITFTLSCNEEEIEKF